jgi:SAM-dependent methyltransferase
MIQSAYSEDYYERGQALGISGYTDYRWLPELTIPLAFRLLERFNLGRSDTILDYGCAKGYLVKAFRLLDRQAYGCDVSAYALAQAPDEIKRYLFELEPNDIIPVPVSGEYDWLIAKDVLEHIPYERLDPLLEQLAAIARNAFLVIPLAGEDGKYVVPAYEQDVTHVIRESLGWWTDRLRAAGFSVCSGRYRWPGLKDKWAKWSKGNGFFTLTRKVEQ